MADGRWAMTKEELNSVAGGMDIGQPEQLPNQGRRFAADDRDGDAAKVCAFCGSARIISGFGGYGNGFSYRSARCKDCGGTTDFVTRDEAGKYFPE